MLERTVRYVSRPERRLVDVPEQDLEVLALGEGGRELVARGRPAPLEDADLAPGVLGPRGDDPLEGLGVDVLRAGAGHDDPARRRRLQRQRVRSGGH